MAKPRLKPIIAGSKAAARFALFWLLMVAVYVAFAHRQAENWYFGNRAGIAFNFGKPQFTLPDSAMFTDEGGSTISNTSEAGLERFEEVGLVEKMDIVD
ncbi:MAG: hypothetical protein PHQ65_12700 [Bacteroidales bacterium]|nr:hypothetical protein [Bacteroidales bacterium]MDD3666118.1 hypothetical protein [Bacteroidales bacterium]